MWTIYWILFNVLIYLEQSYSQNVRHERTRYMSSRDQYFARSYHNPRLEDTSNSIPLIPTWDKPFQFSNSADGRRKYSSRPLFSWDDPGTNEIPKSTTAMYQNYISPKITTYWKYKPYFKNTVDYAPYNEIGKMKHFKSPYSFNPYLKSQKAKDSVVYRNSYVYKSHPLNQTKDYYQHSQRADHSPGMIWRNSRIYNPDYNRFRTNPVRTKKIYKNRGQCEYETGKKCKRISSPGNYRNAANYLPQERMNPTRYDHNMDEDRRVKISIRRYRSSEEDKDKESINMIDATASSLLNDSEGIEDDVKFQSQEGKTSESMICEEKEEKCEHDCYEENGKAYCSCFKGFVLNGSKCIDLDECKIDNGGCEGNCVNTIGSWKCICPEGYRVSSTTGKCIDVNECLLRNGHGPCQDKCTNTLGSYFCSCDNLPGTRLASDQKSCEEINECDSGSAGCSHSCVDIHGRAFCTCPDGFELGNDWKTCEDIDECLNLRDYNVDCDSGCINTIGSFHCMTDDGEYTTEDDDKSHLME